MFGSELFVLISIFLRISRSKFLEKKNSLKIWHFHVLRMKQTEIKYQTFLFLHLKNNDVHD